MAAAKKYANCFVTKPKENEARTAFDKDLPPPEARTRALYLDDEVVKGAFYVGVSWFWQATEKGPKPHSHDFEEVLAFIGTNPKDITDLGGEVEFWLEDEQYKMTKSFVVFVPKNVVHCPLKMNRIDRPILHFSIGMNKKYGGKE
jgi:hypothetical protein